MKLLTFLVLVGISLALPVQAVTLDCGIEKTDVDGRIGVRISKSGVIRKVHPGSPAESVGLKSHDCITAVNGVKRGIDSINGEPGTLVELEVKRGMRRFQVAVERRDVREIYY